MNGGKVMVKETGKTGNAGKSPALVLRSQQNGISSIYSIDAKKKGPPPLAGKEVWCPESSWC